MASEIVKVEEVEALVGKPLTAAQRLRVQMDLDSLTESLEGWCRRKFTQTFIANERHTLSEGGVFFRWGDPVGDVDVRYDRRDNPIYTYPADDFARNIRFHNRGYSTTIFVSYTTDVSIVQNYKAALKNIILDAVLFKTLASDSVRYGLIASYSVEGLSVSFGAGAGGNNGNGAGVAGISNFSLAAIAPLRRNVIL